MMKCKTCGTYLSPGAMFCGECGSSVLAASATSDTGRVEPLGRGMPPAPPPPPSPPQLGPRQPAAGSPGTVPASDSRSYTLRFSTGEVVTVSGAGLVGRNPVPGKDDGEQHLVRIVDPGLSVSKTHLQFGIEAGLFWVSDRRSGNGTTIAIAGRQTIEAVPGERYAVGRGTRIRIGEQYFDIE